MEGAILFSSKKKSIVPQGSPTVPRGSPRSPDLNPIKNIFNLVKKKLQDEACKKKIAFETVDQFKKRIERAIHLVAKEHANKTIASMPKRCRMVLASKGARIPY